MKKILYWLTGIFKKRKLSDIEEDFFRPILFQFPNLLKDSVSSEVDINNWGKDYLSKNKSVEKYIYDTCEALQICGISYTKYKKELGAYSDNELNQKTGKVVGKNFEIEARLALRRTLELFVESWHFKEITVDKEKVFRHFFLIKNLKAFYSRKSNVEEFCDFILDFDTKAILEIRAELDAISVGNVFYLASGKDFKKDTDVKDLSKSFFKLLKEAMPKMPDGQREMVGGSYQLYAETSEVVHGYSGGLTFNLKNYHQEIDGLYARVAVLSSSILEHLAIIGDNYISNKDIKEAINGLKTVDFPQNYLFNMGDKVLVLKQIKAEIVEVSTSKYGCKKYKVKYENKQKDWSWSFEREWFLLKELSKLSDI